MLDAQTREAEDSVLGAYRPLAAAEAAAYASASALPQRAPSPLVPRRARAGVVRNLVRRVKLDAQAATKCSSLSTMIPVARKHLAAVLGRIAAAGGERSLDLARLQLSILPHTVTDLTSLTALDLQGNHISALPVDLTGLTQLLSLDLGDNAFRTLPRFIGGMTSLTSLRLAGNRVRTLPRSLAALPALHSLDLGRNAFDAFPPVLKACVSLANLDLSRNALETLPPGIGALKLLVFLDLSHNSLSSLPPEIGSLAHLKVLSLSHNSLTSLPNSLCGLRGLHSLSLDHNSLLELPGRIGKLRSLARLDVSHNYLTTLPPSIGFWRSLEAFNIDHNLWISMPWSVFDLVAATRSISLDPESRYSLDNWMDDFCASSLPSPSASASSPSAPAIPVSLYTPSEIKVIQSAVEAGLDVLSHIIPMGYQAALERRVALASSHDRRSPPSSHPRPPKTPVTPSLFPPSASLAAASLLSHLGKSPKSLGVRKARRRLVARSRFHAVVTQVQEKVRTKHRNFSTLRKAVFKPKPPPPRSDVNE